MEGLEKGFFYRKEDNSVWADLTAEGLDHKLLLRGDGTSVYMTQDIGTAKLRFQDYPINKMIYVVGNEQTIISRYFLSCSTNWVLNGAKDWFISHTVW